MVGDHDVSIEQDNYGRWHVAAVIDGTRRAPIRCLSKEEAIDCASRLESLVDRGYPQREAA